MSRSPGVTVFKLGGSLLDLPDLSSCVERAIAQSGCRKPLVVVGGGRATDLVREWARLHRLDEEAAHQLAIKSLAVNEALIRKLCPKCALVESRDAAREAWSAGRTALLQVERFLATEEPVTDLRLPHCWDATSDSIAAWTAHRWPAERLVLLKSVSLPVHGSAAELAEQGLVDAYFPQLITGEFAVDWINLRTDDLVIQRV